jgi:hypothetical protein
VEPILLADAAGVDEVGEVVPAVGNDEVGERDGVAAAGRSVRDDESLILGAVIAREGSPLPSMLCREHSRAIRRHARARYLRAREHPLTDSVEIVEDRPDISAIWRIVVNPVAAPSRLKPKERQSESQTGRLCRLRPELSPFGQNTRSVRAG